MLGKSGLFGYPKQTSFENSAVVHSVGEATISADYLGVTSEAKLTVRSLRLAPGDSTIFVGDTVTLGAQSVGAGGDAREEAIGYMTLSDSTVVLSGHAPQTTIGRERATNPYLHQVAAGLGSAQPAPRRGM